MRAGHPRLWHGLVDRLTGSARGHVLVRCVDRVQAQGSVRRVIMVDAAAALGGAGVGLALGHPLALLAGMLAGPPMANRALRRIHGSRTTRLDQQLADGLALQAAALRAGHSLAGSLEVLAEQGGSLLQLELGPTVADIELGRSLDQALRRLAGRAGSRAIELWVAAMLAHRTTGGNLPKALESLCRRLRQRAQMRAEMRALTAQGRLSALVVAIAPLAFQLLASITFGKGIMAFYSRPHGPILAALGVGMELAGLLWVRRILRIEP